MFGNLFKKKEGEEDRIYKIELRDETINENISKIVFELKEKVDSLKNHLDSSTMVDSSSYLSKLYDEIITLRRRLNELYEDVTKIIDIEMQNKEYFIIKDDQFLLDKKEQLENIKNRTDQLLEIVEQKPSSNELREDLIREMQSYINNMSSSINKIVNDDNGLRVIYKALYSM